MKKKLTNSIKLLIEELSKKLEAGNLSNEEARNITASIDFLRTMLTGSSKR